MIIINEFPVTLENWRTVLITIKAEAFRCHELLFASFFPFMSNTNFCKINRQVYKYRSWEKKVEIDIVFRSKCEFHKKKYVKVISSIYIYIYIYIYIDLQYILFCLICSRSFFKITHYKFRWGHFCVFSLSHSLLLLSINRKLVFSLAIHNVIVL